MKQKKTYLIFALVFPIIFLLFMTIQSHQTLKTGEEVTLPIEGYDPKDLLSGHYLQYKIDYEIKDICERGTNSPAANKGILKDINKAYVCLKPKGFTFYQPKNCELYLEGSCHVFNGFVAGVERFYTSKEEAKALEKLVQDPKVDAKVVLAVTRDGKARVKDLLINGMPWSKHKK